MRAIFVAAATLMLIASSALGQTTRTNPSAASTTPTIPSSSSTSPGSPCYSSTNPTSPCYSAIPANPCYSAATPNEPCHSTATPYSSAPATVSSPIATSPPASGRAFTLDQAKARIEAKGYSSVSGLQKGANGSWRGKAVKDGKSIDVILDIQGNIVVN
jgi:hypothetical protein